MSKVISHAMIAEHRQRENWRKLETLVAKMTGDVKAETGSNFAPVLGGETRLMLALERRISYGITVKLVHNLEKSVFSDFPRLQVRYVQEVCERELFRRYA